MFQRSEPSAPCDVRRTLVLLHLAAMTKDRGGTNSISVIEGGWNIRAERRRHTRYPLQIRTAFAWRDNGKKRYCEAGFTRDISVNGLFVLSSLTLPPGTDISLEVSLPAVEPGTPGLRLTFDGVVIRNVESTEGPGFAVAGDFRNNMSAIEM